MESWLSEPTLFASTDEYEPVGRSIGFSMTKRTLIITRAVLFILVSMVANSLYCVQFAQAAGIPDHSQPAPSEAQTGEYHTPLAGEACTIHALGKKYTVSARDRCNSLALMLGGTAFFPGLGGTDA